MNEHKWEKLIGIRLLLTDRMTRIQRNEWTLLEISPNGEVGKFRNELADTCFWTDLDDLVVVDVLPPKKEVVQCTKMNYIIKEFDGVHKTV